MQKSKHITIIILIIIFAYFLFSQFYLKNLGNVYTYFINPLFFIGTALILKFMISTPYKLNKHHKTLFQYVVIAAVSNIVIYFLSGLVFTYGKNPYSVTFLGILLNIYSMGTIIVAREYIRYKLINNVYKNDTKLIFVLIVIVFTCQELSTIDILSNLNIYYIFKLIFAVIIPNITKNCLFTYICKYADYKLAIVYDMIINFVKWISPVLPNSPWIFNAILDTIYPLILTFYCSYEISAKDKEHLLKSERFVKPKGIIPWAIAVVLVVWFAIGIFPIKPIGIMTGSMEPNLNVGDMVIVLKCGEDSVQVNDIIEYKRDNYSVIHRVIDKYSENGEVFFVTKGDNNDDKDLYPVSEKQLQGKVITNIPYVAMPTIWIRNLRLNQENVDIELGK